MTPEALTSDELVHPYLAPVAAVAARWLGRDSFHGGAFALAGDVWGSWPTARAEEHDAGLDRRAGPACRVRRHARARGRDTPLRGPAVLDLRAEAAERLSAGDYLGIVGARERWRLELGEVPRGAASGAGSSSRGAIDIAVEPVPRRAAPPADRAPGPARPAAEPAAVPRARRSPGLGVPASARLGSLEEAGGRLLATLGG